ncbi:hypothetical protein [Pseudomonas fluorescens]|uniref:hypothetical protein n=1 Tax=Pseudomonas fluorescens TaxID=294 RepID=UPI0003634984|nr:hypothetical protein [Pseudomonas fluorescens]
MKHEPSNQQYRPVEEAGTPNEDGCVIGTAGRDEDPNATTDWDHPESSPPVGEDSAKPANGTPGIDRVPSSDNDAAD